MPPQDQFDRAAAARYLMSPEYQSLPEDQKQQVIAAMKRAAGPEDVVKAPPSRTRQLADAALGYLPAAGAATGGALAAGAGLPTGPADVAIGAGGAALGGAAGKSIENTIRALLGEASAPQGAGESFKSAGQEGIRQGAYDLAGSSLTAGLSRLANSPVSERFAGRPLNRLMRPTEQMFDYGNPGVELSKQYPPIFTSKYGLRDFTSDRVRRITQSRDALVDSLTRRGQTVDLQTPITTKLNRASRLPSKFEDTGTGMNARIADYWQKFLTQQAPPNTYLDTPQGAVRILRTSRGFNNAPLKDAIDFRQWLDTQIKTFDPTSQEPAKQALQSVRGAVNEAIHNTSPQLKELDTQIQGLINAQEALTRRTAHVESGVREQGDQGAIRRFMESMHVPGTHTAPYKTMDARLRRGAVNATREAMASPGQRALVKNAPRLAGQPPEEEKKKKESQP